MSQRTELLAIAAVNALRPFLYRTPYYNDDVWEAFKQQVHVLLTRYDAALLQEYPDGIPVKTLDELERLR